MQKILLTSFLLIVTFFIPFQASAQEACIGICPAGTSLAADNETCIAPEDTRPLPIQSLSCNDSTKAPSSTSPGDIDSCVCNPKPAAPLPGTGARRPGTVTAPAGAVPPGTGARRPGTDADAAPAAGAADTAVPETPFTTASGQRCYLTGDSNNGQPIPDGTVLSGGARSGISTAIGCIPTEPRELISGLLKYGIAAAGAIAFLLMLLGALQMITAEGNPEIIKVAQERFYSAIIGLLFIIFSVLLMQVIGVDLLNLPGFSK